MKANELMIGDWVLHEGTPAKIRGVEIYCSNLYVQTNITDTWYTSNYVEPITLTPEILEKNGFIKDTNYPFRFFSKKVYKTRDIGVDFTIKGFSFWMGDTISIAHGNGSRINRLPCYVHELQHALRLCKVDKEIVL